MDKKSRRKELFSNGPVGVWVRLLGPKNAMILGVIGLALIALYIGLRLYIGQ